jgi:hypothetical protein
MWAERRRFDLRQAHHRASGELVSEHDGVVYIDYERLVEPYVDPSLSGHEASGGRESRRVTTSCSATIGSNPATRAPGAPCLAEA